MNIVEKYYIKKASVGMSDEFYKEIEPKDLEVLRRAERYLFIAPAATIGFVFLLNRLRYEVLMSQHFFHIIKQYQEKMQSKYQRKRDPSEKKASAEKSDEAPVDHKNLYKDVEKSKEEQERAKL